MKLSPSRAKAFVARPDPKARAVLVYGPDEGLVRERAERLTEAVAADPRDPFRVVHLSADDVRSDPARLTDEAAAQSLTGGRRVVRLRSAGDAVTASLRQALATAGGDSVMVLEAGELGPRSTLRTLVERADNAAALPCYGDDAGAIEALVREALGRVGASIAEDALAYLVDRLGADRMVSRQELEKLAIYAGRGGHVDVEDVAACIGDSAALSLDDIAYAVADGDMTKLDRALERVYREGAAPTAVLRAVLRHFHRLHAVAGLRAAGRPIDEAVAALRPPVFFKRVPAFRAELGWWPPPRLARALDGLCQAEISCKSGLPAGAVCGRVLFEIAEGAAQARAEARRV